MRIAPSERVVFQNNPLAEVICQVRFSHTVPIHDHEKLVQQALASAYPNVSREDTAQIAVLVSRASAEATPQTLAPVYHYESKDRFWRASLSTDFVALTCTRYEAWNGFKDRMLNLVRLVSPLLQAKESSRVGLRYKDVIEREPIGLQGVPWRELLAPFVLGPLAATELTLDRVVPEEDVQSFVFQSNLRLDDCLLLLQGGLLTSVEGERQAFLVDSDFFLDEGAPRDCLTEAASLDATLERLHTNAGALFYKTIKDRLHAALQPMRNS